MPGYQYGSEDGYILLSSHWGSGKTFVIGSEMEDVSGTKIWGRWDLDDSSLYKRNKRKFYLGVGGDGSETTSKGNNESLE